MNMSNMKLLVGALSISGVPQDSDLGPLLF